MFVENLNKCLKIFEKVYVSSDSQVILDIARKLGAKCIFRPQKLCGAVPNIPVYRHALEKIGDCPIVAVQANSPLVDSQLILWAKALIEMGVEEVMTCHSNRSIYGSIWGLSYKRLMEYTDFYHPAPEALLVDNSIDIHTYNDYAMALQEIGQIPPL